MKHSYQSFLAIVLTLALLLGMSTVSSFAFNSEDFVPELYELDGEEEKEEKPDTLPLTLTLDPSSCELKEQETITIKASATITCQVYDGDNSVTDTCVIIVEKAGGTKTYNIKESVTVGKTIELGSIATSISDVFNKEFGFNVNYDEATRTVLITS